MNQAQTSSDEVEISLADLMLSIWDLRFVIAVLFLLGGLAGALFSSGGTPSYQTKASMIVTARTTEGTYQNGNAYPRSEDIYLSQNLTKTVRLLAISDRVLEAVLEEPHFSHLKPDELKNCIDVKVEDGTSFLWLTLSWRDGAEAVELLNRLMEILPGIMVEVMDIGDVSVIDYAREAVPLPGNMPRGVIFGAAAGILLGCFLGVLYYLFVPKVRGKSSLEMMDLDVIGELPLAEKEKSGQSCYLDEEISSAEYKEAFGRLAVVFRYLVSQKDQRIIAVTSSGSGEGKSTIAYNLALKLTETGSRVLLLDFDFKKGALYHLSKAKKPKDGDVRTESRNGENLDALVETMYNGICTIQGFAEKDIFHVENQIFPAIRGLKSQFDYILIDTPPVGILSDVQQMRDLIEGVLFVVREDAISVVNVEKSVKYLEQTGMNIVGCVLNGVKQRGLRRPGI